MHPSPESPFQFSKKIRNIKKKLWDDHVLCGLVVRNINKHEFRLYEMASCLVKLLFWLRTTSNKTFLIWKCIYAKIYIQFQRSTAV
jgi:hypothetical protein